MLDVGCGTGASALPAAERVGPRGHVIAGDLTEKLVGIGQRKAAGRGLRNIESHVGDMEVLAFPGEKFDAMVCVFGNFFVPDLARQVREFWRMVRPGGQLAIPAWGPRIFEPIYSVYRETVWEMCPDLYSAPRHRRRDE